MKDEPAFPLVEDKSIKAMLKLNGDPRGLTKREYFAGLAMQGYLANGFVKEVYLKQGEQMERSIAMMSIDAADALLAELEKEK